ncbi:malonate decarboxylase holo-[acyl-carrier-protein] synthase [Noviherbaspirillum saxi]|uniref:Malonate decarboxylase holo-[acyl-carrier-protein] synthase n=1 Tax=Noviherbaspirillum saxi TaxID=2320863 RepID=A0A3A3FG59_9BURK|nr:malonate decarboxylase holo-[acyl-carrier-protein] synthase [Noviherbaspirillum saxi]RJF92366.1 malonate decarboxylase holo-[acyl-carrier-protein] synthase [Noviherbaspirillum saxi]
MLARHDLVWLTAEGWDVVRRSVQPDHAFVIERWTMADWPAVVRRQDADAEPDQICLGITPPRDTLCARGGRIRLAFRCNHNAIKNVSRPLAVEAVSPAVPEQWQLAYQQFRAAVEGKALDVRVYGSLSLQALTGESYLTERSDIDLAFFPKNAKELAIGNDLFAANGKCLPLDGEVIFPSGRAVAWKEWCASSAATGNERVLVKEKEKVALLRVDQLLRELTEPI